MVAWRRTIRAAKRVFEGMITVAASESERRRSWESPSRRPAYWEDALGRSVLTLIDDIRERKQLRCVWMH
jgi:hypothetical protein